MGIGLDNYKFGRKNNWRRWSWNRCIKMARVLKKPKNMVCLYLPSTQNIDMEIAKSKGIKPRNMFAIERELSVVKQLRKRKINVICGDLSDVLNNWGRELRIDIVHADLCSPLNRNTVRGLGQSLIQSQALHYGSIVMVNILRGRDAYSNYIREIICDGDFEGGVDRKKHRGHQFLLYLACLCIESNRDSLGLCQGSEEIEAMEAICEKDISRLWPSWEPTYMSYKSTRGNLYMDSVVFRLGAAMRFGRRPQQDKNIKYKIAASKAIRTMRKGAPCLT